MCVEREKGLPVIYEEVNLAIGYRLDLLVESRIVAEVKSVDAFCDAHISQMLTYLKFTDCWIGLLLNFKMSSLKNGNKAHPAIQS
jgi:GxxExxY protein